MNSSLSVRNAISSFFLILSLASCSVQKQIAKSAREDVLAAPALQTAHVGISIYEPATNKYWFNYQGDLYFVPASNTKIPTCYAAMKYLGDSLVGLMYGMPEERPSNDNLVVVRPTGDPSFLHEDYPHQPVFDFLKKVAAEKSELGFYLDSSDVERWGSGWSWNDYDEAYMAERNTFPVFGNVINVRLNAADKRTYIDTFLTPGKKMIGQIFKTQAQYFDSVVNDFRSPIALKAAQDGKVGLKRAMAANKFSPTTANRVLTRQDIPFVTNGCFTTLGFLKDTLRRNLAYVTYAYGGNVYNLDEEDGDIGRITINKWNKIHSQPTDSLLKPMMHRSDNFFAEQSLLMVSNERLGIMNDAKIIDTLLKTDFKDLPQKPRWVDGSGLSRYNLFTPQDLVAIFNKMKNDFGMDRIKNILPTGGEGTFSSYYKSEAGYLFAKTGTLSGVVAISGFLYTKKNKLLIFSVLVNNHNASATDVRRAVEKFIEAVRNKY